MIYEIELAKGWLIFNLFYLLLLGNNHIINLKDQNDS